jgi:hypothetical protein
MCQCTTLLPTEYEIDGRTERLNERYGRPHSLTPFDLAGWATPDIKESKEQHRKLDGCQHQVGRSLGR